MMLATNRMFWFIETENSAYEFITQTEYSRESIIIYFCFPFSFMQMTNIDKLHEMVKSSLFQFVNRHIKAADLSVVDEIVLNYVIAILEEASEDPNFDVDGELSLLFIHVIHVYLLEKWTCN